MPNPAKYDNQKDWMAACVPTRIDEGDKQDQAVAVCLSMWRKHTGQPEPEGKNALKAISRTDDELRVGNYIVLFGGRDLEGIGSEIINGDGSRGEFFMPTTQFESAYTKAGAFHIDWEHGKRELSPDEVLGTVDWKTARWDEKGIFVERVLNRRSKYVQFVEDLIEQGLIGTSTQPVQVGVSKKANGEIESWPLYRDSLTVMPMEPRMMQEFGDNVLQAFKALGIPVPAQDDTANDSTPPEAEPEDAKASASAAGQGRMRMQLLKNRLTMEG